VLNYKNFDTINYIVLDQEFSSSFQAFKFEEILDRFSSPKTLGEHVELLTAPLQRDIVEIVIWLLQRNLIIQLHTYPFCVCYPFNIVAADEQLITNIPAYSYSYVHLVIPQNPLYPEDKETNSEEPPGSDPVPLKPHEYAYLERISERGVTFQLFLRLCPYFRGRHNFEEIMWRENISREEFMKVLERYNSLLVTVTHEGE
jgi:hypothetical protein